MPEPTELHLPEHVIRGLRAAEPVFLERRFGRRHVGRILAILDTLPPQAVVRADHELRWALGLYASSPYGTADWRPNAIFSSEGMALLRRVVGVGYILLFHADGRLRERALGQLHGGARSPFFFAAIALRLNDWAAPVRAAAVACAERVFPLTDPAIVIEAAFFLLRQRYEWIRWSSIETGPLDRALQRPDVAERLVEQLCSERNGPVGRLLRSALRGPGFDHWLPRLATQALHPDIRRVALQALIEGGVRWPDRREKRWIDKSMGRCRVVWTYAARDIESEMPVAEALLAAARDRSAAVRRVAVIALLTHGKALPGFADAAAILRADRNLVLRERTEYALNLFAPKAGACTDTGRRRRLPLL